MQGHPGNICVGRIESLCFERHLVFQSVAMCPLCTSVNVLVVDTKLLGTLSFRKIDNIL